MDIREAVKKGIEKIDAYRQGAASQEEAFSAIENLREFEIPGFAEDLDKIYKTVLSGDLEKPSRRRIKACLKRMELKFGIYRLYGLVKTD